MFDYKNVLRSSNISFELLSDVLVNDDIEIINNIVYINEKPLEINNKKIILWNDKSIKLRRSNKSEYQFLNFFENSEQQDYLLDVLFNTDELIGYINILTIGGKFIYQINTNNNEILYQKVYNDTSLSNNIDLICRFYKII